MMRIPQLSRQVLQCALEDAHVLGRRTRWSRNSSAAKSTISTCQPLRRSFSALSRRNTNQTLQQNYGFSNTIYFYRGFASGADNLPQHTSVPLPALSPTMERGVIKSWEKKEGDKLSEGDLLALIETDKATMDFETPEEGYLAKILVPGGAKDVPLGQIVCIIVQNPADVAAFRDYLPADAAAGQKASRKKEESQSEEKENQSQKSDNKSEKKPTSKSLAAAADDSKYPAHQKMVLPALSPTVEKSTIKNWGKKEGDKVGEGDLIASVETDKATIDWNWENPEEVYVAKILVGDNTPDVPVGKLVAIFVSDQKDVDAFKDYQPSADGGSEVKSPKKDRDESEKEREKRTSGEKEEQPAKRSGQSGLQADSARQARAESTSSPQPEGGRVFASPLARSLAKEKGLDLSQIRGTGPDGRIIAEDVSQFKGGELRRPAEQPQKDQKTSAKSESKTLAKSESSSEQEFVDLPLTNIRQVIAKRLLQSKQTIPHYYLTVEVVLDQIMQLRQELNSMLEKDKVKISVNDFVIKASALACKKVPQANSAWMDTHIRQYTNVDVSVAVSTDAGLITPIVFSAESKGLADINADVIRLADAARKGKLKPAEFQGGTFTVSNLGMYGIKTFSAVINPPQSCILAVGGAHKQLIVDEKSREGYRVAQVMSVTLSCDHRVVDGAVGAEWLKHFKRFLEQPESMLL